MKNRFTAKGFTLIEILIVLAVIGILTGISVASFSDAKKQRDLIIATDTLVSKMEEAKSNAISGKNGLSYGIKFNNDSYVLFGGNTYNPSDTENETHGIGGSLQISNTIPNADDVVLFSRITGLVGFTATVTLTNLSDSSLFQDVVIGSSGDVNVIE